MRVLIFGLPGSGKTTLAKAIVARMPCLYLNGDEVRHLFNDHDFSLEARLRQARRMRALADMSHDVVVIADFVCPTEKTRAIFEPHVTVWMNTIQQGRFKDTNSIFERPQHVDIEVTSKDADLYAKQIVERLSTEAFI